MGHCHTTVYTASILAMHRLHLAVTSSGPARAKGSSRASLVLLSLGFALLVTGCNQTLGFDNTKLKNLESQVTTMKGQVEASSQKIETIHNEIDQKYDQLVTAQDKQKSDAAGFVYAAKEANAKQPADAPATQAVAKNLAAAQSVVGMPGVTAIPALDAMVANQVSAAPESRADGDAALKQLLEAAGKTQQEITGLKTEVGTLHANLNDANTGRHQLQTQLDQTREQYGNELKTAAGHLRDALAEADNNQELKRQLIRYLIIGGILVALGGAAAFRFYPPIVMPLGAASAGLFGLATVVAVLRWWQIIVALCIIGVALAIAAYIRYRRVSRIADNSIGAIEQMKNAARDGDTTAASAYARLRQDLEDWFGKAGHDLHEEIHDRLVGLNVLGNSVKPMPAAPNPAPPAAPAAVTPPPSPPSP